MSQRSIRYNSICLTIGSLVVFCFTVSLAAQQTNDEQGKHYARGMRAIQLGLYDEAIAAFQQVLTLNPQNAEAHCELGAVYVLKEKNRRGFGSISSRPWNCRHRPRHTALLTSV